MDKPRVIFVNRVYWPSPAATAQLLTDLAEALAARGWNVAVIAAGTAPGPRHGVSLHRTGGRDTSAGLLGRIVNYAQFLRGARTQLSRLVQPGDVVVLMTDPPMLGAITAGVAARRGAKVVHWAQDIYPEIVSAHWGTLARWAMAPSRRWRNAAWRSAAACVTLGQEMARTVRAQAVAPAQISIVPNWAPRELDAMAPAATRTARREAWGVGEALVVAYSGNLGRVHEFKTVLAAAELLRSRSDIVFVFVGTGARLAELRAAAAARGLANLRFLPPEPRDRLAAALAAADLHLVTLQPAFAGLVYPSKLAGVLAAGRPVLFVGPADGEIARLLADERCGFAFAPGEGNRLAEVVQQLQAAPDQVQALGENARAAYALHFTLTRAVSLWESVLRPRGAP